MGKEDAEGAEDEERKGKREGRRDLCHLMSFYVMPKVFSPLFHIAI